MVALTCRTSLLQLTERRSMVSDPLCRFPATFGSKITYIPHNVADLRNLVVLNDAPKPPPMNLEPIPSHIRSFTRVVSAPATYNPQPRQQIGRLTSNPTAHTKNTTSTLTGPPEATVQLFLAGNAIRDLPRELFFLKGLTVLSLSEPWVIRVK